MKKWIYRILMLICFVVFGFSAYQLYLIYTQEQEVVQETEEFKEHVVKEETKTLEPDWASLQAENPDIIAWVYVPDTEISFPVVQGVDNAFYLNHTTKKEYNNRGSIFLDFRAQSDFSDDNSIIYGHSVEGGGMFTNIKYYSEASFFEAHPVFYLLTPSMNYECEIMTYAKAKDGSVYYTSSFGSYREEVLGQLKANALYTRELDTQDVRFVTLSTCDLDYGFNSDQRLILTAAMRGMDGPVKIVD